MRKYLITALLAFLTCSLSAFAQQPPQEFSEISSAPGRVTLTNAGRTGATVEAIDTSSRKLTLKLANGKNVDFVAGDEVRNFDQIKVGDEVLAEYMNAIVLITQPGGQPLGIEREVEMARAKQGQKPGGVITSKMKMTTDVVDVNRAKKTITLKDPDGRLAVLNVRNPAQFNAVKVGNQVEIYYAETLAIAVMQPRASDGMK